MSGDDEALILIRGWKWEGFAGAVTRSIADTVNELALNGHRRASDVVLSLLSDGKLCADGNYKWYGFSGEHNQNEGYGAIPARRWRALKIALDMPRDWSGPRPNVTLGAIQNAYGAPVEVPAADWVWKESSFSFATITGEFLEDDYFEEWYSAWEIEIAQPADDMDMVASVTRSILPMEANGGGRPTKLDWEVAALEMAGRYYRGDFKPGSIADVINEIQKWADQADGGPNDNTVRPHARSIFEAFKAWDSDL